METAVRKKVHWGLLIGAGIPAILIILFYLLKDNTRLMDAWVFQVLGPAEQFLGRMWSVVPVSGMEILLTVFLLGNVVWLIRAAVWAMKRRSGREFLFQLLALAVVWLWLWCAFCWMWNAAYHTSTFAQRSGMETAPYSVEQLTVVTKYFAENAARLSSQVSRDEGGHFNENLPSCFQNGVAIYENLTREFPCLFMKSVEAKPLVCSHLQSMLGFTGVYFPLTGEANVNVDAPACLVPATIAHEMAHQRMVSSELEANFIGIAACVTSDDPTFQYSGYLLGLLQLCNALYSVDAEAWNEIAQGNFTRELAADWNDNNTFWAALESPVEAAAGQAYDSFLKENGQELGMRSYGACVDLLVAYFQPMAEKETA